MKRAAEAARIPHPYAPLPAGEGDFYGFVSVEKIGKWLAAPMKKSMGIESQEFVREARNARRAHAGCSAGGAAPVSAVALTAAMIRF